MSSRDQALFTLLPILGMCSCVTGDGPERSELTTSPEAQVPATMRVEQDRGRQPMSLSEAAVLSARRAFEAGDYAGAEASFVLAAAYEPGLAEEVALGRAEALLNQGYFDTALTVLAEVDSPGLEPAKLAIEIQAREQRHVGEGSCEATVDSQPRPLESREDFESAWNDLRQGLQPDAFASIPEAEDGWTAEVLMCGSTGCPVDDPRVIRLEGYTEATLALVLPHESGAVSMLPDLLHPVWDSCKDESVVSVERHGSLLHVRAFSDLRGQIDYTESPEVTIDRVMASLAPPPAPAAGYGSSGYASSGYASSGYYYGGCSGYEDYDYEYDCEAKGFIERDIFIDLARGEVVLDVTRSGEEGSALGRVSIAEQGVIVDACGVQERLPLAWTSA